MKKKIDIGQLSIFIEGVDALYTELGKIERMKKELQEKERLIKQMLERVRR